MTPSAPITKSFKCAAKRGDDAWRFTRVHWHEPNDGVSGDDDFPAGGATARVEANGQYLFALRPNGEPLFENRDGIRFIFLIRKNILHQNIEIVIQTVCGTTIVAAQKLNRKWIGIDIAHLSISLMKYRLKDSFGLIEKKDYAVVREPESIGGARQFAKDDRYQFQWWALSLVQAKPLGGESASREGRKGPDRGIDGMINFVDEKNKPQRVLIQVKSERVKSGDIRDLRGVVEREEAAIGVFITLEQPSREMLTEAVSPGCYHSGPWQRANKKS